MAKSFEPISIDSERMQRVSGIPAPGKPGASRNEWIGLVLALLVFAIIVVAFWYEATR